MCLKIDKTLIGMGFTTGDVRTYAVKNTKISPDVGSYKSTHTHTHTHNTLKHRDSFGKEKKN